MLYVKCLSSWLFQTCQSALFVLFNIIHHIFFYEEVFNRTLHHTALNNYFDLNI